MSMISVAYSELKEATKSTKLLGRLRVVIVYAVFLEVVLLEKVYDVVTQLSPLFPVVASQSS